MKLIRAFFISVVLYFLLTLVVGIILGMYFQGKSKFLNGLPFQILFSFIHGIIVFIPLGILWGKEFGNKGFLYGGIFSSLILLGTNWLSRYNPTDYVIYNLPEVRQLVILSFSLGVIPLIFFIGGVKLGDIIFSVEERKVIH